MPNRDYRDLIAWKRAFSFSLAIYQATAKFPIEEKYGITSQLRKASVSIPSNIAEGQGRNSKGEFLHHLYFALGSLKEVETQLLISDALGYLESIHVTKLMSMSAELGRLINGLSGSLRKSWSLTTKY